MKQWEFSTERLMTMWKHMSEKDKQIFYFKTENFDWINYFETFVMGMKSMYKERLLKAKVIKPRDDSLEKAQKHLNKYEINFQK